MTTKLLTLPSWLSTVLHKKINFPGGEGGECVDLCNDYLARVHGSPPARLNAVNWRSAVMPPRQWWWYGNGAFNYPPAGAIVVWQETPQREIDENGHVAVVIMADKDILWTLDQNWDEVRSATINRHDYAGVLGWWKPLLNPFER